MLGRHGSSSPRARSAYWKNLSPLLGQREVVALQMYAPPLERALMSGKLSGAEAGECDEIADEMGLVEKPTVHSQPTPIWRRGPSHQREDPLKPLHLLEQLWCETDLGLEDLDEPPVAETNALGHIADGRGAWSAECIEGEAYGAVVHQRARQVREERRFQHAKLVDRGGRAPEPVAKFAS